MRTILFSGVHGVGKGYFLDKTKKYLKHYEVYSASSLIGKYQLATDAGYKKVSNVKNNQDILIKAIKKEKGRNLKDFILDGHLCVFNAQGDVERIPEYFFIDAEINGIVLLQDDSQVICDRISKRDSKEIDINAIKSMQDEEKRYAEELQSKFHICHIIISHECSGEQFEEKLKEMEGDFIE